MVKNLPASAGDVGLIPGLGKSLGAGNGNPLQYSYLGNPMHRGALWATAHGAAKSQAWLRDLTARITTTYQLCDLGQILENLKGGSVSASLKWASVYGALCIALRIKWETLYQELRHPTHSELVIRMNSRDIFLRT